jgi:nitroreductase
MHELIENRRSIRKFKAGAPVSREQLNQLVGAAMLAPSAHNTRPWEFIVVTNRERLDAIPTFHRYGKMCQTASAAIVVVALPQDGKVEGFYPQDCGAATQNILLEAVALGLGACWCGIYPVSDHIAGTRRLFDIPETKMPFNIIAIGVPDEAPIQRGFFDEAKIRYVE